MAGIGDLVANLSVNNTGFKKGLTGATSSLKSFVGGMSGLIAPVAGLLAGVWGTSAAISGYKESLEAQRKFQAVLEATGGTAGITAQEMADYASQLQAVTNFEDDATVSAAAFLASMNNIRGDNFTRAIALAQDMATVMGTDLDSAVKKMGKSFKDLSPEEVTKKLDEMQSKFGGAAQAVADPWTQFKNVLGDVGEAIGSTMLPTINVLAESLASMLGVVAGGGEWFKSLGIEAAVVLSHMGESLTISIAQWKLFFVSAANDAAHFFTAAFPVYLTWFGDNWGKVLFTAADYAATIFINLGTNIRNLWQTVLDFFEGKGVNFNWTPLTEGFKSAIDKLPDVPKRLTTDFEKGLQSDIKAMKANIATSMDAQRAELEKKFSPLAKVPTFTAPEADTGDAEAKKTKATKTDLKAAFAGSSEAASIMLRGVGGGKTVEQNTAKLVTVAEKQLAATKANKPQEMFAINFGA